LDQPNGALRLGNVYRNEIVRLRFGDFGADMQVAGVEFAETLLRCNLTNAGFPGNDITRQMQITG